MITSFCCPARSGTASGCWTLRRPGRPVTCMTGTRWVIVDETADEKSSADCAGAARQYSGTVGGAAPRGCARLEQLWEGWQRSQSFGLFPLLGALGNRARDRSRRTGQRWVRARHGSAAKAQDDRHRETARHRILIAAAITGTRQERGTAPRKRDRGPWNRVPLPAAARGQKPCTWPENRLKGADGTPSPKGPRKPEKRQSMMLARIRCRPPRIQSEPGTPFSPCPCANLSE